MKLSQRPLNKFFISHHKYFLQSTQLNNCNEIYTGTIHGANSIKSPQQYFCAVDKTNYHCLSADKITHTSTLGSELNSRPTQNFCGVDNIKYRSPLTKHAADAKTASLCLDLGTTTGWATVENKIIVHSGSKNFRCNRFQGGGIKFLKFINFLDELLTTTQMQISLVFFEEVRRHLGVDAAHAYGGFVAQLTAWCEQHNIAYEGVPVGTIKRHITGRGNATKAQVIESIRARGHQPIDDNEADALALAYWAIAHRLRS